MSESRLANLLLPLTGFDSFLGWFAQGFLLLGSSCVVHVSASAVSAGQQIFHSPFPLIGQPVSATDDPVEVSALDSTFCYTVITLHTVLAFLHWRSRLGVNLLLLPLL